MHHNLETEIKLEASPAMLTVLRAHPLLNAPERNFPIHNTYYDTAESQLGKAGASLRLRQAGETWEQTLKLPARDATGLHRHEWSVPLDGDGFQPLAFPSRARSRLHGLTGGRLLSPVAGSQVERTVRTVRFRGSIIEVAFDMGSMRSGVREESISELELELVEGTLPDLLRLASALPLGRELTWSTASKSARAYALAFGVTPRAEQARPIFFAQRNTVEAGFKEIAWNCLAQILSNYRLIVEEGGEEAVHQCRVGIRRLRSAIKLFRKVVADDELAILKAELKAVAGVLGSVRELDVLIGQVQKGAESPDPDAAMLQAHLAMCREEASAGLQALLVAPPFQHMLFRLACWIEDGAWRRAQWPNDQSPLLATFAAAELKSWTRKGCRRAGRIHDMDDAARHALRVDAKTLRYAAEFFGPLFEDKSVRKRQKRFLAASSKLQDALGILNDIATMRASPERLFTRVEPVTAAKLQVHLSRCLAINKKRRKRLMSSADHALAKLCDAAGWWRQN